MCISLLGLSWAIMTPLHKYNSSTLIPDFPILEKHGLEYLSPPEPRKIFSCEEAAQQVLVSVCLSVHLSVHHQPENIPVYILLQHPECSRMHAESSGMFQNACSMFQNIPECIQNVPECSRMHAWPSRILQNAYAESRTKLAEESL